MADRVGQQLGHYRLLRLLGQGAFAEVYLGEHLYLERPAAIKVLSLRMEPEAQEQFRLEARTIAHLHHPHIVQVLDFGLDEQIPYLVMEYTPGGTLRSEHPKGTRLSFEQLVVYVKQIASALDYAHQQRIIHRDVKPENLLLNARHEIVLSDFGIAVVQRTLESLSTQESAGTPLYMAPEQIEHHPCAASDQYALGIVVYEWLCGEPPFRGSLYAVLSQHLSQPPPSLCARLPHLPRAVEDAVFGALAKDPEHRFACVADFASALEQACSATQPLPQHGLAKQRTQELTVSHGTLFVPPSTAREQEESSSSMQPVPMTVQRTEHGEEVTEAPAEGSEAPKGSEPTEYLVDVSEPASLVSSTEEPCERFASPMLHHRREVLIGLGGLGVAVLLGSAWQFASHLFPSRPFPTATPSSTPTAPLGQLGTTLSTYRGHHGNVEAAAWSADSKRIATASADMTVQIWDAVEGSRVFTYRGHSLKVANVAWSPDGRRIASCSNDQTVQVWDATDGHHVHIYRGHSKPVAHAVWSPDSRRIASCSADATVQIWSADSDTPSFKLSGHREKVWSLAWSPDGKRLASASDDTTAKVWDTTNGDILFTYEGHSKSVNTVAWSPDGARIASSSADQTVQVWDAADGKHPFTYHRHSGIVWSVAWSPPDGKRLVSAGKDRTVQIWDALSGALLYTYYGHTAAVFFVVWSPDGTRIVSGGEDSAVQVWQAT